MHSVGIVFHFGNVVAILISHEILLTTNYPNEKPTKQQINIKPSTVEGFRTSFVQKITALLLHPWEIKLINFTQLITHHIRHILNS